MALLAVAALARAAKADEPSPPEAGEAKAATAEPAAPVPTPGLLMDTLGKTGLANPLNTAGINIYGYVEGGYMYDFTAPHSRGPTFIGFNSRKNDAVLDKISLNVERTVDPTKKQFDMGFRVEGIYGADAPFIHSNGIADTQSGRYQWDLLQAWVDVAFPSLPVRLRLGKWIELAGFDNSAPTSTALSAIRPEHSIPTVTRFSTPSRAHRRALCSRTC